MENILTNIGHCLHKDGNSYFLFYVQIEFSVNVKDKLLAFLLVFSIKIKVLTRPSSADEKQGKVMSIENHAVLHANNSA